MLDINDTDRHYEDLGIHDQSVFSLAEDLKQHPKLEYDYQRLCAHAIKEVDNLTIKYNIIIATIVEEIKTKAKEKGKPIPVSGWQEIRRTSVPLDKRYKIISKQLADATEKANIAKGLIKSWSDRGYRLSELVTLADRILWNEPRVNGKSGSTFMSEEDRLDSAGDKLELD